MQVTLGRIVLYKTIADHDTSLSKDLPAIVCKVRPGGRVDLRVFDEYMLWKQDIAEGEVEGCWRWPPRTPEGVGGTPYVGV